MDQKSRSKIAATHRLVNKGFTSAAFVGSSEYSSERDTITSR